VATLPSLDSARLHSRTRPNLPLHGSDLIIESLGKNPFERPTHRLSTEVRNPDFSEHARHSLREIGPDEVRSVCGGRPIGRILLIMAGDRSIDRLYDGAQRDLVRGPSQYEATPGSPLALDEPGPPQIPEYLLQEAMRHALTLSDLLNADRSSVSVICQIENAAEGITRTTRQTHGRGACKTPSFHANPSAKAEPPRWPDAACLTRH
jgi:hypothetical protein